MSVNVAVISGNLTRDPELRHTRSDTAVCSLSVAVNEREKKGDEWQDRPSYIDVTVWGVQGENCAKYLAKGNKVVVTGRLRQDRWETDDGGKRSKVEIVAVPFGVEFPPKGENGGSRRRDPEPGDTGGDLGTEPDASPDDDDGIPF